MSYIFAIEETYNLVKITMQFLIAYRVFSRMICVTTQYYSGADLRIELCIIFLLEHRGNCHRRRLLH